MDKSNNKPVGKNKPTIIMLIVIAFLVVALVVTAVILNVVGRGNKYSADLVAEIHLSNKQVLAYELYHNDAPIAVENFVYRANNGFYKDSVFYPVKTFQQVGTIAVSGIYKDFNSNTKRDDEISKLNNSNFKYEIIKKDSVSSARQEQRKLQGSMFTWRDSSKSLEGGFAIYLHEFNTAKGEKNPYDYFSRSVMFAAPCDDDTREFIAELAGAEVDAYGIPVDAKYRLTIAKVKIFAKDKKKWDKFDYTKVWTEGEQYKVIK